MSIGNASLFYNLDKGIITVIRQPFVMEDFYQVLIHFHTWLLGDEHLCLVDSDIDGI